MDVSLSAVHFWHTQVSGSSRGCWSRKYSGKKNQLTRNEKIFQSISSRPFSSSSAYCPLPSTRRLRWTRVPIQTHFQPGFWSRKAHMFLCCEPRVCSQLWLHYSSPLTCPFVSTKDCTWGLLRSFPDRGEAGQKQRNQFSNQSCFNVCSNYRSFWYPLYISWDDWMESMHRLEH